METDWFEELKAACILIKTPDGGRGTGYMVSETQAMTCEHVVHAVAEGGHVTVTLGNADLDATVIEKDQDSDSAILELLQTPMAVKPLRFARVCLRQAVWDGFGFPGLAEGIALPLRGTVMDPKSRDKKKRDALLLFSDQIATKSDIHGFSGSPVMVDGYVVGHLKRIIGDDDDATKPAYGYVFASPSEGILKLLKVKPAIEAVDVNEPQQVCIPAIPQERFHVFLSANSANRAFAKQLLAELDARGFRVAADWTDSPNALELSNTAVMVFSRDYLQSALSRICELFRSEWISRRFRSVGEQP